MALTGLDIFKLLPRTNCKDCGKPTCLAFAMALASKTASLSDCPHVSDEARTALEGASAPPMKLVTVGAGQGAFKTGSETVMFRHEEKFHNPTGVAVRIFDDLDDTAFDARLEQINALRFERVGQQIAVDLVLLENRSGDGAIFARRAERLAAATQLNVILRTSDPEAMRAAAGALKARRPLLCGANETNVEAMAAVAKEAGCPLVARAETLDALAALTEKIKSAGVEEIVLDPAPKNSAGALALFTSARRLALKKTFRALGYPILAFACNADPAQEILDAGTYLCNYAGIVVVDDCEPGRMLALLTLRMNIFADPQKPVQVEEKLYPIGNADENSPLLCTTNFSLTYYSVEGEVESSRRGAYILPVDTEGTSVLTAYSADKFNEKIIHKAMQKAGVDSVFKHRKIIIPGYVAVLSGKLEAETGWEVLVGPREASFIPKFLKEVWQ